MTSETGNIRDELSRIEESTTHSSQNQFEQAKIWRNAKVRFAVPASFLAGAVAVGTGGSLLAEVVSKDLAGALILVSAGLGGIVSWLDTADKEAACTSAGNEYLAVREAARVARDVDLPNQSFDEARERLQELTEQRDSINRQSPIPSGRARSRAKGNIEQGGQTFKVDNER